MIYLLIVQELYLLFLYLIFIKKLKIKLCEFIIIFLIFSTNILAEEIIGIPKIIDGDTVYIDNYKIRLEGIDAPEMKQKCKKEKT